MRPAEPLARVPIPARPLSFRARARRTDPSTSHEAAASVRKVSATHTRILVLLGGSPSGLTDEQMVSIWPLHFTDPISQSGLRTRRSELVRMGKVVDSGEKGTTIGGRPCIVWRLADG